MYGKRTYSLTGESVCLSHSLVVVSSLPPMKQDQEHPSCNTDYLCCLDWAALNGRILKCILFLHCLLSLANKAQCRGRSSTCITKWYWVIPVFFDCDLLAVQIRLDLPWAKFLNSFSLPGVHYMMFLSALSNLNISLKYLICAKTCPFLQNF